MDNGTKLKNQLGYLKLITRIVYKNDAALELYPERFDSVPESLLFGRREEFCLARIKARYKDKIYRANIYMVLGLLFEIRILPIIEEPFIPNLNAFLGIQLALEMERNTVQ